MVLRKTILRKFDSLSKQQQNLAGYILEHFETLPFVSVPVLAEKAMVSEATVVRFAQSLGYSGFSELKLAAVDGLQFPGKSFPESLPDPKDIIQVVVQRELKNIQKWLNMLDKPTMDRITHVLSEARSVYNFGIGISSLTAEMFSFQLMRQGVKACYWPPRYFSSLDQMIQVSSEDVVCVFSFPPYAEQSITVMQKSKDQGAHTIAFCDKLSAPIARWADEIITIPVDNILDNNAVAAIMVALNALITEMSVYGGKVDQDVVEKITNSMADNPVLSELDRFNAG